jgi:predicted Zn-dependent peptidase
MRFSIFGRARRVRRLQSITRAAVACLIVVPPGALAAPAGAPLQNIRDSVREFTLDNGLRFLVIERHDAPVFAYATIVDAGGVCEVVGTTGIAHMFEHMAFKGTPTIGTTDYAAEKKALDAVDAAWDAVMEEKTRATGSDSVRLAERVAAFERAREAAARYVVSNEFNKILETNGGHDINAFTGTDMTGFHYSLPSNRLELWARMEGDRLAHPVLREFYTERDVVRNERRMRESSPIGRIFENFLTTSFTAHPYGNGVIGFSSDIENFHRRDAIEFFDKYYVTRNMTICLVGDVTVAAVRKVANKYFRELREGTDPRPVTTREPVHSAERRVISTEDANPIVLLGWQAPAESEPDFAAVDLMLEILGNGRTSRLHQRLVKQEQVATQVGAGVGLPGGKYPNIAGVFIYAAADGDPLRVEQIAYEEIHRLIADGPAPDELQKVKRRYLADHIRRLRAPENLAIELAAADQIEGHWSKAFERLERVSAVTVEDVRRVATERLVDARRTVGMIVKPSATDAAE